MDQIEIYVRPSGGVRTLLNIYVPQSLRERFIEGIRKGTFEFEAGSANIELTVLPEWVTDEEQRAKMQQNDESIHIRTGITSINIMQGD